MSISDIPMFLRKFVVDSVETFVATLFAMNLAIPGSLDEAKAISLVLGAAMISAIVSAARRAAPAALAALRGFLGVAAEE